jgi:hypothetical protein
MGERRSFDRQCVFTVSEHDGGWWADRVNPNGRTKAAVGPYRSELEALRAANHMNQLNQGWFEAAPDA